jgi:hypothetical protein
MNSGNRNLIVQKSSFGLTAKTHFELVSFYVTVLNDDFRLFCPIKREVENIEHWYTKQIKLPLSLRAVNRNMEEPVIIVHFLCF